MTGAGLGTDAVGGAEGAELDVVSAADVGSDLMTWALAAGCCLEGCRGA